MAHSRRDSARVPYPKSSQSMSKTYQKEQNNWQFTKEYVVKALAESNDR